MAGNFEEFGPEASGARLAEKDYAADITNTMANLFRLSSIQENEAQRPLYAAQARKAGAEAELFENKVAVQKKMAALMAGRQPGKAGENPLFELADIAAQSGDLDEASKLLVRGTQVETSRAMKDVHVADVEIKQLDALRKSASLLGSMAASAVDQSSYDRFRAAALSQGFNVDGLPEDYASARPTLNQLTAQGMTVKQWVDSQIAEKQLRSREKADAALVSTRAAQEKTAGARLKYLNTKLDFLVKNEGENSASARELRQERTKLIKQQREVSELKNPPPIPMNPKDAVEGRVYKLQDGSVVKAVKKPDGTLGITPVVVPKQSAVGAAGSAILDTLKSLGSGDDDLGGDDDDE